MLSRIPRRVALLPAIVTLALLDSSAAPVTFSTVGAFSVSGTNVVNFTNINGTTTITFNGTTNPINSPAGVSFGDIVVTSTVPANKLGPTVSGTFTLTIVEGPSSATTIVGSLSGTLGFNTGITSLTFSPTGGGTGANFYNLTPPSYTLAVPVAGVGGGAGTGTIGLEGSVAPLNLQPDSLSPDPSAGHRTKGKS